jgi:hypothetical protein
MNVPDTRPQTDEDWRARTNGKYRYRFVEPMMQPFILMQGLRSLLITRQQVTELAATHYEPRFSSDF